MVSLIRIRFFFLVISLFIMGGPAFADPLHLAVRKGDLAAVKHFIEQGADINSLDRKDYTPLMMFIESDLLIRDDYDRVDNTELAEFLINNGAFVKVDAMSNKNWTPLHYASFGGRFDTVRLLIKHGASVNAMDINLVTPPYFLLNWAVTAP